MKARPEEVTGEGKLLRVRVKEPEKQGDAEDKGTQPGDCRQGE